MSLEAWSQYVDEVRAAALPREAEYIERVAGPSWKRKGRGQYVCLSPLRTERTPSFFVFEGNGRSGWHDFGTGESGDLFAFVERKNGCDFRAALEEIARFCGIPTWEDRAKNFVNGAAPDPVELMKLWRKETTDRQVFQCLTDIMYVCHAALPDRIRDYLNSNYGLDDEFIDLEKIGYCPNGLWKSREQLFPQWSDETLLATGFFHKATGTTIFSQRIVFPYWKDSLCRYVIGRAHHFGIPEDQVTLADWDKAKYKKLSTFDEKTRPYVAQCIANDTLWGEDCLRGARGQLVIVTEGVTDAAMLRQLGYNVLSPVTVRFRSQDIEKISAVLRASGVKEVVILNDADEILDERTGELRYPGLDGAKAMAAELWKAKIQVRIGRLPKPEGVAKIDVNEIGRDAYASGGEALALEVFRAIVSAAEPYPDFLVSELGADGKPVTNAALGERLKEIAVVSTGLGDLAREDLLLKVFVRVPYAPRKEVKKAFKDAVRSEIAKQGRPTSADGTPADDTKLKKPKKIMGDVVTEEIGYYERGISPDSKRISTFSLVLKRRVVLPDRIGDLSSCRVVGLDGNTLVDEWVIPRNAWGSKKAFIGSFPHAKMQWTGDDDDVQRIAELLVHAPDYETVPRCVSTPTLGRYGEGENTRFVLPAGTIDRNGAWMENPDVVHVATHGPNLLKRLPLVRSSIDTPTVRALAKRFFEEILTLHEPSAMGAMVGWWMSSLFRPALIKKLNGHPVLNVFARPGAGKTSLLARAFWPAFTGVTQSEAFSCATTGFMFMRDMSSSNAVGIWFDEYKNDLGATKLDIFHRMIRTVYNGGTESRGLTSQDSITYILLAPVCISGETQMSPDQAVIERCVYVGLDGNWIREHPADIERWYAFKEEPWSTIAPFLQAWSLRADPDALLEGANDLTKRTLESLGRTALPERIVTMLTTVVFGLLAFDALAVELKATTPPCDLTRIVRQLLGHALDEDAAGTLGYYVRDNFDDFLLDASTMANLRLIQEETHYVEISGKLCLWVPGIEAVRSEWRRGQNLPVTSPGARALKKIAIEKMRTTDTYITAVNKQVSMETGKSLKDGPDNGEARPYCIEVDLERVPSVLTLSRFPVEKARIWGKKEIGKSGSERIKITYSN